MEPRLRACPEQFALLIRIYGKLLYVYNRHGDFAKPQLGAQGRLRSKAMRSVGGGVVKRLVDKWKKVWAEWKTKTKKKHLDIRYHASGTGGGPSSRHCLTPFEEKVISVLGVSAVSGQLRLPERGFNTAAPPADIEYVFDVEDVVVEVPYIPPLQFRRHHHSHPNPLLHFRFLLLHSHHHHYHRHSLLRPRLLYSHPRLPLSSHLRILLSSNPAFLSPPTPTFARTKPKATITTAAVEYRHLAHRPNHVEIVA